MLTCDLFVVAKLLALLVCKLLQSSEVLLPVSIYVLSTHTHSVLTVIFPGEPGLAGCPLNSPSSFIPGLRILLEQLHSKY